MYLLVEFAGSHQQAVTASVRESDPLRNGFVDNVCY
jgi:hypothetical protein